MASPERCDSVTPRSPSTQRCCGKPPALCVPLSTRWWRRRRLPGVLAMLLGGVVLSSHGALGQTASLGRAAKGQGGAASDGLSDPLTRALRDDSAAGLRLTWALGTARRLQIEAGQATLWHCAGSCQPVGKPLDLSAGERAQLMSRLRGSDLLSLQKGEGVAAAGDRTLELFIGGRVVGEWQLPRAEWPVPPDGYGVADYLDDVGRRIEVAAAARQPLAIPQNVADLAHVRLQLKVQPRRRPGGTVQIEQGTLRVLPEEGQVPRDPPPRAYSRALSADEQATVLTALTAARWDDLDRAVEKREQPAIGDDDGRLATLHLLPSEGDHGAVGQPRGLSRFVVDLQRSSARPLVDLLLGFLTAPPPVSANSPAGRGGRHRTDRAR